MHVALQLWQQRQCTTAGAAALHLQCGVSHDIALARDGAACVAPAGAVPAAIQDRSGHACLLVLPSDQPSNRKEALAVEELLAQLLQVGLLLFLHQPCQPAAC
jgi:hypothetical protein